MKELSENEALYKAAAYCSAAEHCRGEMEDKLEAWEIEPEAKARILKRLVDEKYIDDARYCRCFVKDKFKFNKWGKIKISQALWQKRIAQHIAVQELATIDEEEYMNTLHELLAARKKTIKANSDYELNGKLIRFALGRGFEMNIIQRCVKLPDDEN
ncbi:MAG: regulatory protein RecX [Bacteroides sp.]